MDNIIKQVFIPPNNLYDIANAPYYCMCYTDASTAAKEAVCDKLPAYDSNRDDVPWLGMTVNVNFHYSQSATNPTLSINNCPAKPLVQYGNTAIGTDSTTSGWQEGSTIMFTYNGISWVRDQGYNTNTQVDISGKEDKSDKVTSWSATTTDIHYPSEKLVKDSLDNIVNLIYPVGSIYMSVNSTSPATLFGGTWVRIEDKFLLSAGTTYGAGTTGGNANHTPSGSVSTTVNDHTLTISEIPKHSHTNYSAGSNYGSGSIFGAVQLGEAWAENTTGETGGDGGHNHGATSTFTGTSQNTMPPYLAVYMWKRTL